MTLPLLRIGTRKSALALTQANMVRDLLMRAYPGLTVELLPMVTSGDRLQDKVLAEEGGKGLFTKEIEDAMLEGSVDIAVHSMKDMQTVLPDRLLIACTLPREDARDALVGEGLKTLADLPQGALVGTSSLRRAALVKLVRPDAQIRPFRGNVDTRLAKLARGEVTATLLAVAGLKRLGILEKTPATPLPVDEFVPAIAQGAIGIECREDAARLREMLEPLSHVPTLEAVTCERAFLRALDGSCRTPIAGYAVSSGGRITFQGLVAAPDGSASAQISGSGAAADAERLGREWGMELKVRPGVAAMLKASC